MKTLPILQAPALFDHTHPDHAACLADLKHAITEIGFLVIRNHPVLTTDVITKALAQYLAFFKSPIDVKQQVNMANSNGNRGWGAPEAEQVNPDHKPDFKEVFDCSMTSENLWPESMPDFQTHIQHYFEQASIIAYDLLMLIAAQIDLPPAHFHDAFDQPMSLLRGNYYPAKPGHDVTASNQFGIAPHTDYGCLTLLISNTRKGLDIQTKDGQWHAVTMEEGDIVINFGEMLQSWSNQKVRATLHRVIGDGGERVSSALFFNPAPQTNIAPFGTGQTELAGDYLNKRYNETYLHLKG